MLASPASFVSWRVELRNQFYLAQFPLRFVSTGHSKEVGHACNRGVGVMLEKARS